MTNKKEYLEKINKSLKEMKTLVSKCDKSIFNKIYNCLIKIQDINKQNDNKAFLFNVLNIMLNDADKIYGLISGFEQNFNFVENEFLNYAISSIDENKD